jgi:ribosomal protein S18 acetylase RimI-like enzyme
MEHRMGDDTSGTERETPVIRPARPSDAPAIAALHTDSWRRHYRRMYSDRYLDGDLYGDRLAAWTERVVRDERVYFTLLAELHGQPVGFAHVMLDADPKWGALVDNLHVAHSAQGSGIGSLLLDRVARSVIERRPGSGIYLWVLEQNEAARRFYVSRGGVLRDSEPSAAPGNDPRNLHGSPMRVRVSWSDPSLLLL